MQESSAFLKTNLRVKFFLPNDIDTSTGQFKCINDNCMIDGYHAHCLDCEAVVYKIQDRNAKIIPYHDPKKLDFNKDGIDFKKSRLMSSLTKHKELHETVVFRSLC